MTLKGTFTIDEFSTQEATVSENIRVHDIKEAHCLRMRAQNYVHTHFYMFYYGLK